jgi:hypothetical protein
MDDRPSTIIRPWSIVYGRMVNIHELLRQTSLFLGAHPDDIEIGCGALIHNIVNKTEILCVTLSDNQKNPDLKKVKNEHLEVDESVGSS